MTHVLSIFPFFPFVFYFSLLLSLFYLLYKSILSFFYFFFLSLFLLLLIFLANFFIFLNTRTLPYTHTHTHTHIYIYIYIYHHHVVPPAQISLTLSRHFSLSFIASGRSSGLHPVSSHIAVCKFALVVLLLLGHTWGSIGVHHLRARLCFSSNVLRVWFV